MLNVYLDQKDRIALLKADAGKPERPTHAEALTVLRAALEAGNVSLPLSHVHYQETSHRKPFTKRVELAKLMAELSRFHSIAPFYKLSRQEMRYFIAAHFEAPITMPDQPAASEGAVTTPSATRRSPMGSRLSRQSSGRSRAAPTRPSKVCGMSSS